MCSRLICYFTNEVLGYLDTFLHYVRFEAIDGALGGHAGRLARDLITQHRVTTPNSIEEYNHLARTSKSTLHFLAVCLGTPSGWLVDLV